MFYSVDRFEGQTAVLVGDDGRQYDVPRSLLPKDAGQSDILRREDGAYLADAGETARRKARIQSLLDGLPGKG